MWDKFTEKARKVIYIAQEEATRLGHTYVGPEHILLGIIKDKQNIAARTLSNFSISTESLKNAIEQLIPRGETLNIKDKTFTPRAKSVLEIAYEEARIWGHSYIGTEHLLIALIRVGEGIPATILFNAGLTVDRVRKRISQAIGSEPLVLVGAKTTKIKTPLLNEFSRDLTYLAKEEKLDPVIGREKEIERVIQILAKRIKNNPILVGRPGVGKTAIVEGLSQRIVKEDVPLILRGKRVVMLDLAGIVAGTKYRGEFEERIKRITQEILKAKGEIILFIDEVHNLIGAGGAEGALDASNILKPCLSRGELQCVGATTLDDYRKYIEKDAALERRFQMIIVEEPTVEQTIEILRGLKEKYEQFHQVMILDEALISAVKLSDRYITNQCLPDKAIDVLDETASRAKLKNNFLPPHLLELDNKIRKISQEKEIAILNQEYERAADLRDIEKELQKELNFPLNYAGMEEKAIPTVSAEEIAYVISSTTGIPLNKITEEEGSKLLKLEEILHQRIIGQDEAIKVVSRAIRRSRAGIQDIRRPIGSFIFLGPTGVGKTELARTLSELLFGSQNHLIRFDMSEYMERFAISRLIGAPPGYVGYDEGGQLTEQVRRKPYSVVLFDEIEKAHPEVFNLLLQIMDEGHLTDSLGHKVNFKNTIIIMTSNIGGHIYDGAAQMGFRKEKGEYKENTYEKTKAKVLEELKKIFRPEFLNRLDGVVVFHPLSSFQIREIVDLMLQGLVNQLKDKKIKCLISDEVKDFLAREGYDKNLGARPLKRCIQKYLEDPLSDELLSGRFTAGEIIEIRESEKKIIFEKQDEEILDTATKNYL